MSALVRTVRPTRAELARWRVAHAARRSTLAHWRAGAWPATWEDLVSALGLWWTERRPLLRGARRLERDAARRRLRALARLGSVVARAARWTRTADGAAVVQLDLPGAE